MIAEAQAHEKDVQKAASLQADAMQHLSTRESIIIRFMICRDDWSWRKHGDTQQLHLCLWRHG